MRFTGERMIPEFNQNEEIYLEHINRYLFASQFVKGKTVLDIACGSGYGSDFLLRAGAKAVVGIDMSEEAISYCKNKYQEERLIFLVGSVENIPLKELRIDIIISMETIEHVNGIVQTRFLEEARKILKPEGFFILSTPNSLVVPKGNTFHIKELAFDEFEDLLKRYFSNIKIFFQDNVVSNFILSREVLENKNILDDNKKIKLRKLNTIASFDSMFFIAVCHYSGIEFLIDEYVALFNIKTCEINLQEIASLRQELRIIKSSKFWKVMEFYGKLRQILGKVDRK